MRRGEMRACKEGMTLAEPRFMDFVDEFDSPWSVTMATIWPNLIVQRGMNTLGIRQIVPAEASPHEFIMKWTMFGFEGDDGWGRRGTGCARVMRPAGFLGLEDNEAIKFRAGRHATCTRQRAWWELDPADRVWHVEPR